MKFARVAAPLAAVLMFAGCSTPSGGTAFSVDGTATSQSTVDDATSACARLTQQDASALRAKVAQLVLMGQLAPAVAKAGHISLTSAMENQAVSQLDAGPLLNDPACASAVRGFADFNAVANKLGKDKTIAALKGLDVKVNPVYGTWDPETAAFTPASGSLSSEDLGLGKVFGN